jgi:hypothetical protein
MNAELLALSIVVGGAVYHAVVTILDAFTPDKPKRIDPPRQRVSALASDAAQTKRRMEKEANRYHRLRGIV